MRNEETKTVQFDALVTVSEDDMQIIDTIARTTEFNRADIVGMALKNYARDVKRAVDNLINRNDEYAKLYAKYMPLAIKHLMNQPRRKPQ